MRDELGLFAVSNRRGSIVFTVTRSTLVRTLGLVRYPRAFAVAGALDPGPEALDEALFGAQVC